LNLDDRTRAVELAVRRSFPVEPVPDPDELVVHDCDECVRIAKNLKAKRWTEIGDDVLADNSATLALLSPMAHRYFLPAFLVRSIAVGGDDFVDWIVYDLCPADELRWIDRFGILGADQLAAVGAWMRLVIDFHSRFDTDLSVATSGWERYWSGCGGSI
jgi:hypothetical protein